MSAAPTPGVMNDDNAQRAMLAEALQLADADDGWATWVFAAEPNGRVIAIARLKRQGETPPALPALPARYVFFGACFVKLDHDEGVHVRQLTHNWFGKNPAFEDAVLLAGEWIDGVGSGDIRVERPQ